MAISTPNYDPATTAAALAEKYVSGQQQMLTDRTKRAAATEKALNDLRTALSNFQTALSSLTSTGKSVFAQSATFSDTTVGSAVAKPTAAAGTYSFHVERLATASQVSYALDEDSGASGTLAVNVGLTSIDIDLDAAGSNGKPPTPREIAAAINASPKNTSLVTASVITTAAGKYELVLTAKNTGKDSEITVAYNGTTPPGAPFDSGKELVAAQDALIYIGSATGTPITQASNTFNSIDGVSMTFTKTTSSPVTLTVGADAAKTKDNVQAFVDAYNKMKSTVDTLTASGDPAKGVSAGAFAGDSGINALRTQLVSLLRPTGADSLALYGITANRQGTLSLDTVRLNKALEANPAGLDTLIGNTAGTAGTGLAGKLDTYLKKWTTMASGQIHLRKEAVSKLQLELTTRQDVLDKQYDTAYNRYLMQFSQLQTIQNQMLSNSSMFDALFSSKKD
ncbi:MAG: flagellar filament capping protein FliD [Janthinobacterium lividum]